MKKQSVGRPAASCNVHIIPEPSKKPDIEKLGRVFIAIAVKSAIVRKGVVMERKLSDLTKAA